MRSLIVLLMALIGGSASAKPIVVREIVLTVQREGGSKKYPNPVTETYQLDRGGVLRYSAYFGNMPMEWNHNDSIEWRSGDAGKQVLQIAAQLVGDHDSGAKERRGSELPDSGVYFIRVAVADGDAERVLARHARGFPLLDGAFQSLIAAFERATHRPLTPDQLPQAPSR